MNFDVKFFTLLTFIVINFSIIFFVKTRTTTIISLSISHLLTILFLTLEIDDYALLKEIILAIICYAIMLLFLISNHNNTYLINATEAAQDKELSKGNFAIVIVFAVIIFILLSVFIFLLEDLPQLPLNEIKEAMTSKNQQQLVAKLKDNFLLKRSSDIILIIASSASLILLFSSNKTKIKS